jgi:hypothetical protein
MPPFVFHLNKKCGATDRENGTPDLIPMREDESHPRS